MSDQQSQMGAVMTFEFCKVFLEVTRQGNFVKAAQNLNLTPSAVSHSISKAENEMGFQLFQRNRKGVTLTAYGESVYQQVKQVQNSLESLQQTVDQLNGLEKGCIRIGTFNSVCSQWIPKIVRGFKQSFPNIMIELYEGTYDDVIGWIEDGSVDFGFLSKSCRKKLEFTPLYQDPLVCVVPRDFPIGGRSYMTLEDMRSQPFVIQREACDADIQNFLSKHQLEVHSDCHVIDDKSSVAMVESGFGIGILPRLTTMGITDHVNILEIRPKEFRIIGIAALHQTALSPAADKMFQYIVEEFRTNKEFCRNKESRNC